MKKFFKRAFNKSESTEEKRKKVVQKDLAIRKATEDELNLIELRLREMKEKEALVEKEAQVAVERAKQKQLLQDILNAEQDPLNPDAPNYFQDEESRKKEEAEDIVSGILGGIEEENADTEIKLSHTPTKEAVEEPIEQEAPVLEESPEQDLFEFEETEPTDIEEEIPVQEEPEEQEIELEEVSSEVEEVIEEENIELEIEEEDIELDLEIEEDDEILEEVSEKSVDSFVLLRHAEDTFSDIERVLSDLSILINESSEESTLHHVYKRYQTVFLLVKENKQFTFHLSAIAELTKESDFTSSEESLLNVTNKLAHIQKLMNDTLHPKTRETLSHEDFSSSKRGLIQERVRPLKDRKVVKVRKKKLVNS